MFTKKKKKILVVDDDDCVVQLLRMCFQDQYEVLVASNVADGLEIVATKQPNLVLMDVLMHGQSGIDGLRIIRGMNPSIPVIMQSGSAGNDTVEAAEALGADGFLMKPFDISEMARVIANTLELQEFTQACARDVLCA